MLARRPGRRSHCRPRAGRAARRRQQRSRQRRAAGRPRGERARPDLRMRVCMFLSPAAHRAGPAGNDSVLPRIPTELPDRSSSPASKEPRVRSALETRAQSLGQANRRSAGRASLAPDRCGVEHRLRRRPGEHVPGLDDSLNPRPARVRHGVLRVGRSDASDWLNHANRASRRRGRSAGQGSNLRPWD